MPAHKKDPSVRSRANTAATASTLTRPTGRPRVPALPKVPGLEWHPATKTWWTDVWRSPMASEYLAADRRELEILAVLHNDFWNADDAKTRRAAASEIRLQRMAFGLTPYDRRRLEWTIEEADAATSRGTRRREQQGVRQPVAAADPRATLHAV